MTNVSFEIIDSSFKKYKPSIKDAVLAAASKLRDRYQEYYNSGISIVHIFNDRILIHDVLGKNKDYYVYKYSHKNIQIRLLYKVSNNKIIIVSCHVKNGSRYNSGSCHDGSKYLDNFRKLAI